MSRKTCRPRLPPSLRELWRTSRQGELRRGKNGFIFVAAMCLGLMVTSARGGSATNAPMSKTGQTNSYASYDDGWYSTNVGVAWPNPRFTVQANTNVVQDNLTGLIWARNANILGATNWDAAVINCNNLTYGDANDWRLPNKRELFSLIDDSQSSPPLPAGHPFTGVQSDHYWSSTTYANGLADYAWSVALFNGYVVNVHKSSKYCVWPVRGGE